MPRWQLSWQSSVWSYYYVISQFSPKHLRFFRRWTPLHHQICLSLTNVTCVPSSTGLSTQNSSPSQHNWPLLPTLPISWGPTQRSSFSKKHSAVLSDQAWSFPTLRLTAFPLWCDSPHVLVSEVLTYPSCVPTHVHRWPVPEISTLYI